MDDFSLFFDAFAQGPRDPEQLNRFTSLKTKAAALIAPGAAGVVGLRAEVPVGAAGTGLVGLPRSSDLTGAPPPALNTLVGFGGNVAEIGGERNSVGSSGVGVFRSPTHGAVIPPSRIGITSPSVTVVATVVGVVPADGGGEDDDPELLKLRGAVGK